MFNDLHSITRCHAWQIEVMNIWEILIMTLKNGLVKANTNITKINDGVE
jgi:hypothetical protein